MSEVLRLVLTDPYALVSAVVILFCVAVALSVFKPIEIYINSENK
jgi:hypothetical protein